MTESTETTAPKLPYVSWGSFTNFIDKLRVAGSVPGRIDRQFLGGSGAYQSQMLQALKFFGLVNADLRSTEALRQLALADDEARMSLMADIVRDRYAPLLALGLDATQSEMEGVIRNHGLNGDTVRKAASLFLSAAKYGDVPVSSWFKVGKPATVNGKRKIIRRTKVEPVVEVEGELEDEVAVPPPAPAPGTAGSTRIALASGGHLTFSYSVDLFAMSTDDRNFVFKLIDEMRAYEQTQAASPSPVVGSTDDLDEHEEE